MKILLSAVGKSDPMTCLQDDVYDGAILHICRHYRPNSVYLYMSKQICEFDALDHRYEKSLHWLEKSLGHTFDIHKIQKEDLQEVHLFDQFYEDFEKIIEDIINQYGLETEILLNLSSGTPAMKSAFQIIAALSKYHIIPIQVSDPSHGKQQRADHLTHYDVDIYWALNLDQQEKSQNRCFVAGYSQFSFKVQKEIIAQLIKEYDYEAACSLIKIYAYKLSPKLVLCSEFALSRYKLDKDVCRNLQNKLGVSLLPYKQSDKMALFEYSLFLKLKSDKKEYLDVVRGINPFLFEASKMALKILYDIDIKRYMEDIKLSVNKLQEDATGLDILKSLNQKYREGYKDTYLTESQMIAYLKYKDPSSSLVQEFEELDKFREMLRNIASHQITCIKEESIQRTLKHDMAYYIESIKHILTLLGYDTKRYWCSYDEMNDYMLSLMFSQKGESHE